MERNCGKAAEEPGAYMTRIFGVVNVGSFRISAMVAGVLSTGELAILGVAHREAWGIKRGYVVDMGKASHVIRDVIERAERAADTSVARVYVGFNGGGLASQIARAEIDIEGRRITQEDIDHLLQAGRNAVQPNGRMILHAQPVHYTLGEVCGVVDPRGLHAERLGVDIHVLSVDGASLRNISEAVHNAHLQVEAVVPSLIAAGLACLTPEEREVGVALIEIGAQVTNVAVYKSDVFVGLVSIPMGSGDITEVVAATFGIGRLQAERLKCVSGSAVVDPADHREMIAVNIGYDHDVTP